MKKLLSIILAILMIVTTVPMAFAAEETLDFSDAKVLSTNNGYLYIDGEKISVVYNTFNEPIQNIPGGKYILGGDMNSSGAYAHTLSDAVSINLNGYTWDFGKKYLSLYVALSIYDTSIGETGKMTSSFQRTIDLRDGSELNLYSGTVENNSENDYSYSLQALTGTANLYGGKLKSNKYAINCNLRNPEIINLVGTVLESGEGYGQLRTPVTLYDDEIPEIVIDVSDYNGIDLTLQLDFYGYTDYVGKYTLIKGVENAEEAEKYKIKINYPEYQPDVYVEEIGYDEATGEIYLYTATNAFTQQPSVDNNYTAEFTNPEASFQWGEVEETVITPDNVTAIEGVTFENEKWLHGGWYVEFFTVDANAGDMITASTTSDCSFELNVYTEDYSIDELVRATGKASATIDSDAEVIVGIFVDGKETTEFEFLLTSISDFLGTGKTLQNPECAKKYICQATVGENVYLSDVVTVGHDIVIDEAVASDCANTGLTQGEHCTRCDYKVEQEIVDALNHKDTLVQVDAKAPTCTEIGWDAYEYCTACDYTTYVEIPENGHTALDAVIENEVASKCGLAGSYDLVVYCACGEELDRDSFTVEALKHSFTKYEVTQEAKCGVEGKKVAACDNGCGETDEKAIEALKHSFTKYEETEAPKCGIEGKKVAVCDNGCGATDEKAIEALKHDIVIDEAVAPKCGESGLTQGEHCTRCDYKVEQEVVPALKHSFTKYEETEAPKCGVEGKEVATCDHGCGATDEKAIAALTHTDADGDYKCDNGCGHEFEKPAPEEPTPDTPDEPDTPDTPDEPTDEACDHLCHKSGILGFFWKIVKFFSKLFKINPVCECGAAHY